MNKHKQRWTNINKDEQTNMNKQTWTNKHEQTNIQTNINKVVTIQSNQLISAPQEIANLNLKTIKVEELYSVGKKVEFTINKVKN